MGEPISFPEANKNLSKPNNMTDEECGALPVHSDGETCISLWGLSWRERLSVLIFGKVWLGVLSGKTQPPVWVWGTKTPYEK